MRNLMVNIKSTTPEITDSDVSRGYFYRFFAAKANQIKEMVYEVDRREYDRLRSNPYIVRTRIKWKIRGNLEDTMVPVYTGDVLGRGGLEEIRIPGVLTENMASVIFASEQIPAIKKVLTKYDQYYVETSGGGTTT